MVSSVIDRNGGTVSSSPVADRNTGLSTSSAVKGPCRVCSASNITLSGLQTIDGVTVAADDRVLVTGQTDTTLNGIYIVSTGTWQRSPDFNRNDDVRHGTQVRVHSGTTYSGLWVLTSADPITMGTSAITWSRDTALVSGALLASNDLSDVASAIAAIDNLLAAGAVTGATPVAASGGTLNLSAATDFLIEVGAGNFSAITLGNSKVRLLRFQGVCVITFGANLSGNTAATTYTTAAGDKALLSVSSGGVKRLVIWPKTGAPMQLLDSVFRIQGSSDQTKKLAFEVDGFTTGQTRTATPPDADFTIAALNIEAQTLTGGANVTVKDLGNLSGNTITPTPGNRPKQKVTNNGAGSILPGSTAGDYILEVINTTGAGAITTTGWTLKGDAFDTTTTSKFLCSCSVSADIKLMSITKVT